MTLSLTSTKDWVAVSNEKERRYENVEQEGKEVLKKFNIEWFLNFYEDQS